MYREVIDAAKDKMQKTIHVFQSELRSIRAGRANPQLLERVMVDYYGTPTPLTQMGNVSAPEPRMLLVSVWDQSALTLVEKAIQKSDLGINPSNDGKVIRLIVPELTEERRKELTKVRRQDRRGGQGGHPRHPPRRDGSREEAGKGQRHHRGRSEDRRKENTGSDGRGTSKPSTSSPPPKTRKSWKFEENV